MRFIDENGFVDDKTQGQGCVLGFSVMVASIMSTKLVLRLGKVVSDPVLC